MKLLEELYWRLFDYSDRFNDEELNIIILSAMTTLLILCALLAWRVAALGHLIGR